MPRPLVAALAALTGLVAATVASAHVVSTPAFLPSGGSESITFEVPNERSDPMTEFALTVPPGLVIAHAHPAEGWSETLEDATATWSGGALAPGALASFGVTLEADAEPGTLALEARQLYADGGVVEWAVSITVTPAAESPSENLALAGVVGLLGVLVVIAIAMLAWRRRG